MFNSIYVLHSWYLKHLGLSAVEQIWAWYRGLHIWKLDSRSALWSGNQHMEWYLLLSQQPYRRWDIGFPWGRGLYHRLGCYRPSWGTSLLLFYQFTMRLLYARLEFLRPLSSRQLYRHSGSVFACAKVGYHHVAWKVPYFRSGRLRLDSPSKGSA